MNVNILDYIKVYENIIPTDLTTNLIDELNSVSWEKEKFYDYIRNLTFSNPNECSSYIGELQNRTSLNKIIINVLDFYVKNVPLGDFIELKEFSAIKFLKYEQHNEMVKHVDHIKNIFDGNIRGIPVLSVIGLLNDNFDGGKFIMFEDHEIDLKRGDILIFPSVFLYPHKVSPVIEGTRYSFTCWAH